MTNPKTQTTNDLRSQKTEDAFPPPPKHNQHMTTAAGEHQPLLRLELDIRAQSSIYANDEEGCSSTGGERCYKKPQYKNDKKKGSSAIQTALNIAKLCMGTGTLALPFAAEKGGLLLNMVGLAFIALWNYYCANCVLRCSDSVPPRIKLDQRGDLKTNSQRGFSTGLQQVQVYGILESPESSKYLQHDKRTPPPEGTTSFGEVAWYAAGPAGLMMLDFLMLLLSVMLIIAYEVAMFSFIDDIPITTGSRKIDVVIPSVIVALLSCSPDVSFLSKFSIIGLMALSSSFSVIVWQGLVENGLSGFQSTLNLWPRTLTDASSWFGVVVFGYGIVPFILNFRESMADPDHICPATKMGLILVLVAYIIMSNGVTLLFSPSHSFDGDVLQALPKNSWIALIVRLLMTFVVSVTAPLIVVPCGEMIEGKLGVRMDELYKRIAIRLLLCVMCTGVAEYAPGFVHLVSFMGCFCVSIVSFVLPPLFCIQLGSQKGNSPSYCDISAFVTGIMITIFTSTMTFGELRRSRQ